MVARKSRLKNFSTIMHVQNVASSIGIPSVGMRLFKIAVAGIVTFAEPAAIGENGTAQNAINVPTE